MIRAEDFLTELIEAGISIRLEKGDLRVRAPRGGLTAGLRDKLRTYKPEIVALLGQMSAEREAAPISRRGGERGLPLSFAQQRLWLLEQFAATGTQYHMPLALRFQGPLALDSLARSLTAILARHEALRSRFPNEQGIPGVAIDPATEVPIDLIDLDGHGEGSVDAVAGQFARLPFDLALGPLYRFRFLRLGAGDHILLACFHHIVIDAWSMELFVRELRDHYLHLFGLGQAPPPMEIQYPDFASWQREDAGSKRFEAELDWWKGRLAGDLPVTYLPVDHQPKQPGAARGARHTGRLEPDLTAAVQRFAGDNGATSFMLLLSVWFLLLFRYGRQQDLLVGSPIAGRNRAELEPLIGFFVNMLVLRCDLDGRLDFLNLLDRVRRLTVDAFSHQDIPFEKLVEVLHPERGLNQTPFFRTVFGYQDIAATGAELGFAIRPGLPRCRPHGQGLDSAKFELLLTVINRGDHMDLVFQYNELLFEAATIGRLSEHFIHLLTGALARPQGRIATVPMLASAERRQLLAQANAGYPQPDMGSSVVAVFRAAVAKFADREAIRHAGESLDYASLGRAVASLSRRLTAHGVGPGKRVAVHMARSNALVIAILATLEAGATYVPIDPAAPEERKRYILRDALVHQVISDEPLVGGAETWVEAEILVQATLPREEAPGQRQGSPRHPQEPAYIIYTSGSTGQPKGSIVTHGNLMRLFDATHAIFDFSETDRWTLFHSHAFDFSVWEIWGALLHGGCLVVVPAAVTRNPEDFYALLVEEEVTVLNQTPSAFRELLAAESRRIGRIWRNGRWIIFGGEALEPACLEPWYRAHDAAGTRLVNMFGITETTVHVTWRLMSPADLTRGRSQIGGPIPDLGLFVLDPELELCPINVPGELCVAGAGVTSGYLGQPALTALRFVPHPFGRTAGERLYRSGDLGCIGSDGERTYFGRMDNQIKLRGFRIEVGEIEAALLRHEAVAQAVVRLRQDADAGAVLLAWVVVTGPAEDLRAYLKQRLPEYMIPAAVIAIDALPLTLNGKLDEKALPVSLGPAPGSGDYTAPGNSIESELVAIWESLLKARPIGVTDNFFDIGGHSLVATQVMTRIRERFGKQLPLELMFTEPTIAELAVHLAGDDRRDLTEPGSIPTAIRKWWQARLESADLLLQADNPRTMGRPATAMEAFELSPPFTERAAHEPAAWLALFLYHYTGRQVFRIYHSSFLLPGPPHLLAELDLRTAHSFSDLAAAVDRAMADARKHYLEPKLSQTQFAVMRDIPQHPFATVRLVVGETVNPDAGWLDPLCGATPFDLALVLSTSNPGSATLFYGAHLFRQSTVKRMARHLATLWCEIGSNPRLSSMSLLSGDDRRRIAVWNQTERKYPIESCFQKIFAARAQSRPEAPALVMEAGAASLEMSYGRLLVEAYRVADELVAWGVQPGDTVGLCVSRSFEMVAGLLGTLFAGAAYLPLDPSYPVARLAGMIESAGLAVVLSRQADEGALPASNPWLGVLMLDGRRDGDADPSPPLAACSPDHPAYVIFTSGSTGRPKAIRVAHRGLCNLVYAQADHFQVRETSRVLQFASFSFDASVSEIAVTLGAGATLILAEKQKLLPGNGLEDLLDRQAITHVTLPPSVLAYMERREFPALATLIVAGEACSADLAAVWSRGRRFLNAYGPSENTVCATIATVPDSGWRPSIGRPIANCRIRIADRHLRCTPLGVPGELCIGGVGLAQGYLDQPALTATAFVPDPDALQPGGRLYRSGDLARYLADGEIEFLGRIDQQVKLRGFRIETGEIEAVLREIPDIQQALVLLKKDGDGGEYLVAYTAGAHPDSEAIIRDHLASALPEYMLPARILFMGQFPLTPSGKVDLAALPEPERKRAKVAPTTATESSLAEIWGDVLKIAEPGIEDNFFESGGHSLLATRLFTSVNERFGLDLSVDTVFDHPTIVELATVIDGRKPASPTDSVGSIVPVSRDQDLPLSFAQQRLWFLDRFETSGENRSGSIYHNIAPIIRMVGTLDLTVLELAISELLRRHESLRTLFPERRGRPVQDIRPASGLRIPVVDLSGLIIEDRRRAQARLAAREVRHRFDLGHGPLLRLHLLRHEPREQVLLITLHHIICDGWSFSIMIREITQLYEAFLVGREPGLAENPVQYADFAHWQRRMLADRPQLYDYWRGHLVGIPRTPLLPVDFPRPAVMRFRSERQWFSFEADLVDRLKSLGQESGASLFMVFHGLFSILLSRFTKSDDIVMGTNIANRNYKEIESVIGFFVNTVVLRCRLAGDPDFRTVLERVRRVNLDLYAHQDMPFDQLVELLQPERNLGYSPIFQVMFVYQNFPMEDLSLQGLELTILEEERMPTGYEFGLSMVEKEGAVQAVLEYNTDLFHPATIQALIRRFLNLAELCAQYPERPLASLNLVDEEETGGFSSATIADDTLSQNEFEDLLLAINKIELPG